MPISHIRTEVEILHTHLTSNETLNMEFLLNHIDALFAHAESLRNGEVSSLMPDDERKMITEWYERTHGHPPRSTARGLRILKGE